MRALPVWSFAFLLLLPALSWAQTETPEIETTNVVINPAPPKTKLEAVATAKGVLVIGGFTDIGTISTDSGEGVLVTAVEYTNASNQERHYGLILTVHQIQGSASRYARSYIDEDELDDLISSLEAMQRLDHTATQLADFTGRLRTRGDLEIGNVPIDGARALMIRAVQIQQTSGEIIWAVVHEPFSRMSDLIQCVTSGKQTLDKIKSNR
ncbi:MAG: hypothetical protein JO353_07825 [Phycisphaerae bacterium]|nr:hypothetical protein [Phycisphaerae bacterium]